MVSRSDRCTTSFFGSRGLAICTLALIFTGFRYSVCKPPGVGASLKRESLEKELGDSISHQVLV